MLKFELIAKFGDVRLTSGELVHESVKRVDSTSFQIIKLHSSILLAKFSPLMSFVSFENHKLLCAFTSLTIMASSISTVKGRHYIRNRS